MDRKQRKNRPKKKEMTQETWELQLENLRRVYEYAERKKE